MENIIRKMRSYYPVSDEAVGLFASRLKREVIPAKTTIIEAGRLAKKAYFIERGIARCYLPVKGNEVTTWFCMEGDVAYGSLTLFRDKPCFESIETLEETEAYTIDIYTLRHLYTTNIDLANWKRSMQEDHFLWLCDIHFSRLNLSGKERYEKMLTDYPGICSRVNLGYIASFLGMTLPSLSRIRGGR